MKMKKFVKTSAGFILSTENIKDGIRGREVTWDCPIYDHEGVIIRLAAVTDIIVATADTPEELA